MPEVGDDAVALREFRSQTVALVPGIAHLLFQGLDSRVGRVRDRLSRCDTVASAGSVGKDAQGYGQQDASREGKPNVVPIDLGAAMSVSLSEGKTSLPGVGSSVCFVRVHPQSHRWVKRCSWL